MQVAQEEERAAELVQAALRTAALQAAQRVQQVALRVRVQLLPAVQKMLQTELTLPFRRKLPKKNRRYLYNANTPA
jgi:hypothetical protein